MWSFIGQLSKIQAYVGKVVKGFDLSGIWAQILFLLLERWLALNLSKARYSYLYIGGNA